MIVTRQSAFYTGFILFVIVFAQGCALYRGDRVHSDEFPDFARVIVRLGDTLPSLARRYLDDPGKSWVIADFNNVSAITTGQELIIPLEPFTKGDLSRLGYQEVPVLSYHNFSESKQNLMMVRRRDFERQMKFLKDNAYTVITLDDLFDFLEYREALPRKAVVITIDDGWQGVYDIAYPVLKKYNFPATLFVYTDLISGSRKTLDWNQVAELDKNGIDIQCHTISHRNLNKIKGNESFQNYVREIEREISESTRIIKKKIGKDVKYLAYPYGDTNNLVIAFLKKNGFRGAFTVKRASNPFFVNHFTLNRRMIYGDFDLRDFKRNLKIYSRKALR
ncbi:MAG: polysaccharide deacetylase family protein [Thermodesulfobacteriota bacterium]|nr:polysaccharide deacetylase family protein [Thermodesulfobacteriota bacterium]